MVPNRVEVGFVRNQGYLDGTVDWRDELESYSTPLGSGYMPLGVGNTWRFVEVPVSTSGSTTWGEIKTRYR